MSEYKHVLHCLDKKSLLELSQLFGFKEWTVLKKDDIIDRFANEHSVTLQDLLAHLNMSSLKDLCWNLGVNPGTTRKKGLINAIVDYKE